MSLGGVVLVGVHVDGKHVLVVVVVVVVVEEEERVRLRSAWLEVVEEEEQARCCTVLSVWIYVCIRA